MSADLEGAMSPATSNITASHKGIRGGQARLHRLHQPTHFTGVYHREMIRELVQVQRSF
jgi:hypothetical protein